MAMGQTARLADEYSTGNNDTTRTTSGTLTPTAGSLFIAEVVQTGGNTAAADSTLVGPNSLPWTFIRRQNGPGTGQAMQMFALLGDGSAAGALVLTAGGSHNWDGTTIRVFEVTGGVLTLGANGAGAFITANSAGQATTTNTVITKAFAQALASGSLGWSFWVRWGGNVSATPRANWTEAHADDPNSTLYTLNSQYSLVDRDNAGIDYGADAGQKTGLIFELAAAAAGAPRVIGAGVVLAATGGVPQVQTPGGIVL